MKITPEMSNYHSIMDRLIQEPDSHKVIRLPESGIDYFIEACRYLLMAEDDSFASEEELLEAVKRMQQACGDDFSEEKMAEFLDKGLEGDHFDLQKMFADSK